MNLDEFEQKLRSQPMREIPGEWRREILGSAAQEVVLIKQSWWREWLWPCPQAWAVVAAAWALIAALNLMAGSGSSRAAEGPKFAVSQQGMKELQEQQATLARLVEPQESAATTPEPVISPRSERGRKEFGV
jgi:hypothetical protein